MNGKEKELLTPLQHEIINTLKNIEEAKEFYFTGGSALGFYYLKHRLSDDLDFFTHTEELIQQISRKLKIELEKKRISVNITRSFKSFVEMIVEDKMESTKIQFAFDSPYRLEKTQNFNGVIVDSVTDMAVGKLLALFGRASERDFVDIYFIVKEGFCDLNTLIQKASEKDPGMDKYYLAIAFEQVRNLPDDQRDLKIRLLKPVDIKEMKQLFIKKAVELLAEAEKEKKNI